MRWSKKLVNKQIKAITERLSGLLDLKLLVVEVAKAAVELKSLIPMAGSAAVYI